MEDFQLDDFLEDECFTIDPFDADLNEGSEEIDEALDNLASAAFTKAADTHKRERVASRGPKKTGGASQLVQTAADGDIDANITASDMMILITSEIKRKRIAGHHIDSMNSFNRVGIKQIATKIFSVDGRVKNQRDKTEEDQRISDITFKVEFTDIKLTPPVVIDPRTNKKSPMTPAIARLHGLTYSAQMYIDATITAAAYLKSGGEPIVRQEEIKNHRIAAIPCLVGSELCVTHGLSREALKQIQEDPTDPGGYFIIKGSEWTIDNLENITNNSFHVHKNMTKKEIVRGTFLSKPGDAFENSYQIIIRYLVDGGITVEVTTNKFNKFGIPFYLWFRVLGMTRDIDIVNNIVYGVNNTDPVTQAMLAILEKAMSIKYKNFEPIEDVVDTNEVISYIAQKINPPENPAAARKDENVLKYLNNSFLNIVDRYILPHVGTTKEDRIRKCRFLGHLINKLLCVHLGILEPTDRDSYRNKRIHSAGTSIAKAFKTDFNFAIVQEIKKALSKDFRSTPFSQVKLAETVKSAIKGDDLEKMLMQSIVTGEKVITVRRNEVVNRVASQMLNRKNDLNVISTLNTVNTPNASNNNKQNERADEMRRVHPTYLGYIDVSQSAETGEKVGMTKQLACTASVCGASDSYILKDILADDPDIIPLDDVTPEQITAEKLAKVFVNGDWVGCCREYYNVARKYRLKRRLDEIHHLTTIVCEATVRELYFWTDVGRLVRPLVIVYNNIDEYNRRWRAGDREVKFKQWIKLTRRHIEDLRVGKISMDDLRREGVIEYISPEEQENYYLAPSIDTLREHQYDLRHMYTHCDIEQAIFGLVTLAAPFANHSSAVRTTLYTNHRRQSCGWPTLNYPFRIEKGAIRQYYIQRPLLTTVSDIFTRPAGLNCIVALALHGGFNQEDSITANRGSVSRGMFGVDRTTKEQVELDNGEQFGNPDEARTMERKKDADYSNIEGGFVREGTIVNKGSVLVVKSLKLPKPIDNYLYVDRSVVYKKDEPAIVEKVILTHGEDTSTAKVRLSSHRPLDVGDKLCLTPDHEVLTTDGWIPIEHITKKHKVATLVNGEHLEYTHPLEIYKYHHRGDIVHAESNGVSQCVTPNHRLYVRDAPGAEFKLIRADTLLGRTVTFKKSAKNPAEGLRHIRKEREYITDIGIYLSLLGLLIRETADADLPRYVPSWVHTGNTEALKLARDLGMPTYVTEDIFIIKSELLRNDIYGAGLPEYIFGACSSAQCNFLLNALMPNGEFFTHNKKLADDIARLAIHAERSVSVEVGTGFRVKFEEPHADAEVSIEQYEGYVHCLSVPSEVFLVRRNGKVSWTGNSSRTGNKGICSITIPQCDMPYTEDGLVPDLIVNAHSIPTRMAINQIIECMMSQLAAMKGVHIDATSFRKIDIDAALVELEKFGIKYGGHRRMYNGVTGEWIDTLIFIGPTTYQRLQKFILDENYANRRGPTSSLTRQPLAGRGHDGGIRLGEMEKDVYCAQGVMKALYSKFYYDSDGTSVYICRNCGNGAVVNERIGMYKCKTCGDNADIAEISSSWTADLLFKGLSAMNIKLRAALKPHMYSEQDK